jgi:type I restriction enzyme S subunit
MKGWKECKLGDSIELVGGGTPKTSIPEYWNGNIPWLSVVDFNTGKKYVDQTEKSITELGLKNSSTKILNPKDIIISARGTVGVIAVLKREMAFNQSCYGIRNIPNITEQEFLYYLLKDSIDGFKQIAHGGVFDTITRETFDSIDILLPPLPEQKAIAAVLSSLDDKIDLLHRQNKTLEAMAETLFRQWFVEEADEGWEEGKLSQYVDIGIGRTPPRQEHEWFSESETDIKWISIKDLGNDGTYIFKTAEYLTRNAVERFNVPVIPSNTVVLSFKMTVGRVAITTEKMLSNEAIAHFKFKHDTPFSVEYLYFYLKTYQYDSLGSTSSIVTAINSAMIKDLSIIIPDISKMNQFNNVVKRSFEKIRSNQVQIRTLESLRDTLLPKLMSGEVRVKV